MTICEYSYVLKQRFTSSMSPAVSGDKGNPEAQGKEAKVQTREMKIRAVLLQGGLIERRKEGLRVFYACPDPKIYQICDVVCGSLRERLARDLSQLQEERRPRRSPGRRRA
jgi:hypothetical protein